MTEREALVRSVCEWPGDDTPRRVFADWCEENGEPQRATFIRAQIESSKCPKCKGRALVVTGEVTLREIPILEGDVAHGCNCYSDVLPLINGPQPEIYLNHVIWFNGGNGTGTWVSLFHPVWSRGFVGAHVRILLTPRNC